MNLNKCEDYSFLKPIQRVIDDKGNEEKGETEVLKSSIEYIFNKYHWYKNQGYTIEKRRQRIMPGFCLSKKDLSLDISADIITAVSAFTPLKDTEEYAMFKRLYWCHGNVMPICEGGNIGGRPYKTGASLDYYSRKLDMVKSAFEDESNKPNETAFFKGNPREIGRNRRYLIDLYVSWQWKSYDWKDYIDENYLEDFVTADYQVKDFSGIHEQGKSIEALRKMIELVIRRSYRLEKEIHGLFKDDEEEEIRTIISTLME